MGRYRPRARLAFDTTLVYLTGGLAFGRLDNRLIAHVDDGGLTGSFIDNTIEPGGRPRLASSTCSHHIGPCAVSGAMSIWVRVQCMNANDACTGTRVDFHNTLMLGLVGLAYKF